jgi:hypothetical protein
VRSGSVGDRFREAVDQRLRALRAEEIEVSCDGTTHRLRLGDDAPPLVAVDHDTSTEAVLGVLGGSAPTCMTVVEAARAARTVDYWSALRGSDAGGGLLALPAPVLAVFVAGALATEFAGASPAVRDVVAKLGLALLDPHFAVTPRAVTQFQRTRRLPTFDVGDREWSDRELEMLTRCLRVPSPARDAQPLRREVRPRLDVVPTHPEARRAVARYCAGMLRADRVLSEADVRAALSPTLRNVRALIALLVSEGLLDAQPGGFRVLAS